LTAMQLFTPMGSK